MATPSNRSRIRLGIGLRLLWMITILAGTSTQAAPPASPPPIQVILWFDTEDYLLPADDDATLRLAKMLSDRGIRATFKLVGEKARVLERRHRTDVIKALRQHDIGYHSDFHSVHPTPTEYLADAGWLDGIAEFVRREGDGAADVRRIFHRTTLSCYGQPGASWAPQAVGALSQIGVAPHGVPCYLDEDAHIGMEGKPFWYAGALNVFRMKPNLARMDLYEPGGLESAKHSVKEMVSRLQSEDGGLISIYYHPCEWVHTEFWDGVNFARGANPPREAWKAPGQRPPQETEAAFVRFGAYLDYIRQLEGVRWITASELPKLYPDRSHSRGLQSEELTELSRQIQQHHQCLNYQRIGSMFLSVADQFEALARAVLPLTRGSAPSFPLRLQGVTGPDSPPPSTRSRTDLNGRELRDTLEDVVQFLQTHHRVPARVFVGADAVPPADLLVALSSVWLRTSQSGVPLAVERFALGHEVAILPERHLAKDTPKLFGNWIIHREGFRAPKLLELARLQTWSLKPAIPLEPDWKP